MASVFAKALGWFGFGDHGGHSAADAAAGAHGHTHGVIDASLTTTDRGIWAIKWSFVILAITSVLQLVVVYFTGSVALLADTIHNFGDATTAIPLWVAFVLVRRKPSKTFTYGLGRVEDLAGILIVVIILFSAIVAGYQAIDRLINPQPVYHLGWLVAAGIIGFLGNEIVAVFRIRVGRQMNSAALIADGYHARTDGLTSLAVVGGAIGVWLGYPLADPIIGLLITVAILGIVWQSARAVLTRSLDGVEPAITDDIRHAAQHVPGITRVVEAKARWIGHRLHADIEIAVSDDQTLAAANEIASRLKRELVGHMPALRTVHILFESSEPDGLVLPSAVAIHPHHAPDPFRFAGDLAAGVLEIAETPQGERMRLTLACPVSGLSATVIIERPGGSPENLPLHLSTTNSAVLESALPPAEPHEFVATLLLALGGQKETLAFRMVEPEGHAH